jgi:hypothetical protein
MPIIGLQCHIRLLKFEIWLPLRSTREGHYNLLQIKLAAHGLRKVPIKKVRAILRLFG